MTLVKRLTALERRRPEAASRLAEIAKLRAKLSGLTDEEVAEYAQVCGRAYGLDITEVAPADVERLVFFAKRIEELAGEPGTA